MNTAYTRVIPRDFFNEGKLLKCMGLLSLKVLDCQLPEGIKIEINDSGDPFEIALSDAGYLQVMNYQVTVNGQIVAMQTIYNSKANYPLVCFDGYDEFRVFDSEGNFQSEFVDHFLINYKL